MATLVTGSTGFLGGHLIRQLLKENPNEEMVTISQTVCRQNRVKHHALDMADESRLVKVLKDFHPDTVYHFAGSARVAKTLSVPHYFRSNFLTTASLMHYLSRLDKPVSVFFSSSAQIYGNQPGLLSENAPAAPVSPYGFSKYLVEELLRSTAHSYPHLHIVVGRLSTCIGPSQQNGFVISDLCNKISRISKKRPLLKVGALNSFRQFLDVDDAVQIFPLLLQKKAPSNFEVYNIASPGELKIGDALKILLKISRKSPKVTSSRTHNPNRWLGNQLDIQKLCSKLPGYHFTPIQETLKKTYRSYTRGASE